MFPLAPRFPEARLSTQHRRAGLCLLDQEKEDFQCRFCMATPTTPSHDVVMNMLNHRFEGRHEILTIAGQFRC
jgi:hypothetical protein